MSTGIERIHRSRSSLADEVYDRLVDALLQGTLVPGDRLIQDKLAEDLDVSRTPVRDALLRLHEEGAIEAAGRRGYIVRELSSSDVSDIYDARYAIEGHAAEIVAGRGAEAIARLRAAVETASTAAPKTSPESFKANRAIHRTIVVAAGNPHLVTFFDAIWGRALAGLAYHDFYAAAPYEGFADDHLALVDDIATGDPEHARRAMVDHIRRGLDRTLSGRRAGAGAPV